MDFGTPWALKKFLKNEKKFEKINFPTRSVLKEGSGTVLGQFWEDFERVLDGF